VAQNSGIRPIFEVYSDLAYDKDGNLVISRHHEAHRPEDVAEKVIRMVKDGKVRTTSDTEIDIVGSSVCVHSDSPGAIEIVKAVRKVLTDNGYAIESPQR
jgi:UPF0271 protein